MSIVIQKEKTQCFIQMQAESQDYSEIISFLQQIRNYQIPSDTHSSPFSITLLDLRNEALANPQLN